MTLALTRENNNEDNEGESKIKEEKKQRINAIFSSSSSIN